MTFRYKPLVLALALCMTTSSALAAGTQGVTAVTPVAQNMLQQDTLLQLLSVERLNLPEVNALYRQLILANKTVQSLEQTLLKTAKDNAAKQARAFAIVAALHWQHGQGAAALQSIKQSLAKQQTLDGHILKARLLASQGDGKAALSEYQSALALSREPAEKRFLQLRIALLANDNNAQLMVLAQQQDASVQNRTALVLALEGQPQAALSLYQVDNGANDAYAQYLRLADWAIDAKQYDKAQQFAWQAYLLTQDDSTQRYALAVLIEAYRTQGQLESALRFLQQQPTAPLLDISKVDVLLELGQFESALNIVQHSNVAELRQRLLGILDIAGRSDEVITEYKQLIAKQPEQTQWYYELAVRYLSQGDEAQALAVYQQLFNQNVGKADVLIQAAGQMIAMGLSEPALTMIKAAGKDPATTLSIEFFRFEMALKQGQDSEALQILQQIQQQIGIDSPLQNEVADGYERLRKPDLALAVLQQLEQHNVKLSYDQQVHLAMLAAHNGKTDEALTRWWALWAQAKLPARKNYLEKQIITLAQQQNTLGDIAKQLAERLDNGSAEQSEINLLISIYLQQRDRASAEAAVEKYATYQGVTEAEKLAQLGMIYSKLKEYRKQNASLRQLMVADADNADIYLRQLTLNTLKYAVEQESEESQHTAVTQLLTELNALTEDTTTLEHRQFVAGVYAMASMPEQAIAEYRQALAQVPDNADNVLQLVTLLKKQNQQQQAAALLQYLAEFTDDKAIFMLAIDGLLTLFAPNSNAQGMVILQEPLSPELLKWAQRLVLEKMASSAEDFDRYSLLADLSSQMADANMVLRAHENSLAMSGSQRSNVLRMLIGLASGTGNDGSSPRMAGDQQKKLRYGRRLIALKQEFPPDLYSDLAKGLLAQDDILGAESAFAMISDISGLVNVGQIKGEAYDSEGYNELALINYSKALLRNQDSPQLAVSTSVLREQLDQPEQANHWYWQALQRLILQQPQQSSGYLDDTSLDFNRYYATLVEGLLLTWPQQATLQQQILSQLQQLLADSLAQIDSTQPLSAHNRLMQIILLQQRLAEFLGDKNMAQQLADQLTKHFGGDTQYLAQQRYSDQLLGLATVPELVNTNWPLLALKTQADASQHFELLVALAITQQDTALLEQLLQQALQAKAQADAGNMDLTNRYGQDALFRVVLEALDKLPAPMFKQHVLPTLQQSPYFEALLFDLLRSLPEYYDRLVDIAGSKLLTPEVLIKRTQDNGGAPMPVFPMQYQSQTRFTDSIINNLSTDQLITLYSEFVASAVITGGQYVLPDTFLAQLLRQPLTAEQRQKVLKVLKTDIERVQHDEVRTATFLVQKLLVLDAAKENQQLMLQAAQLTAARYPDGKQLPTLLKAWFAEDKLAAFLTLQALYVDTSNEYQSSNYSKELIKQYFSEQRQAVIDAFIADPAPTEEQITLFYQEYIQAGYLYNENSPQVLVRYFSKLVEVAPDNKTYLAGLLFNYWQQGLYQPFIAQLQKTITRNANPETVALLTLALLTQGQTAQAEELAKAHGIALANTDWLLNQITQGGMFKQSRQEPDMSTVLMQLYYYYEQQAPDSPLIAAIKQKMQPQSELVSANEQHAMQHIAAAFAEQSASTVGLLRRLWRETIGGEEYQGIYRRDILQGSFTLQGERNNTITEAAQLLLNPSLYPAAATVQNPEPDLLATLVTHPEFYTELEHYLAALTAENRQRQQHSYNVLVQGLVAQKQAESRFAALKTQLIKQTISNHQLQLFATLSKVLAYRFNADEQQALTALLQKMSVFSANQRLLFAAIYAKAEDYRTSEQLLQATAMQILYPEDINNARFDNNIQTPVAFADIIAELTTWQNTASAQQVYQTLMQQLLYSKGKPERLLPELDVFIVRSATKLAQGADLFKLIKQIKPELLTAKYQQQASKNLLPTLIWLNVQQQQVEQAQRLLTLYLQPPKETQARRGGSDWLLSGLNMTLYGVDNTLQRQSITDELQASRQLLLPNIADQAAEIRWLDTAVLALKNTELTEQQQSFTLLLAERYQQLGKDAAAVGFK